MENVSVSELSTKKIRELTEHNSLAGKRLKTQCCT